MQRTTRLGLIMARLFASGLLATCVGPSVAKPGNVDGPAHLPSLTIRIKPLTNPSGEPTEVETTISMEGAGVEAGAPLVQLPLVSGNMLTAATTLTNLKASDAMGELPLDVGDVEQGQVGERVWKARRATSGVVTLSYRVPAAGATGARGAGTPVEMRRDAGAISASASTFLLLPPDSRDYRLSLDWDLSSFPADAKALSSFGPGSIRLNEGISLDAIRASYYMAGHIGTYPSPAGKTGFNAAWQGEVPVPAAPLMAWTRSLYDHYSALYRRSPDQPYSVFVRYNPINGGGGVGQFRSFVLTYKGDWPANEEQWLKFTLAHEMYHTFQPHMGTESEALDASWFNEGTAVYYGWMLPVRYGLSKSEYLLSHVNMSAMRYYTSIKAALSNDEVARNFWADTRIRMLAYDRGAFYFAIVDQQIRKRSGGKRSLDDLLLALKERENAGHKLVAADWEQAIAGELGPSAATDFRNMLAGKLQLPRSDVFGPCFQRTSVPLRRYELGFDPNVLISPQRVVRGLVPGSEAEKAGLRNGDRLVNAVPQDFAASSQTYKLTFPVQRAGREFIISYLPRGEAVNTPQWKRVVGSRNPECR